MRLMRRELELLFLKKNSISTDRLMTDGLVTDELGGVALDCGAPDSQIVAFCGKIRPLKNKIEMAVNGFVHNADFVLFTTDKIDARPLDCVCTDNSDDEFIIVGIRSFVNYSEFSLERKC